VPSLLNLQGQLSLNSYTFDEPSGTMALNIAILQEISADALMVGFTIINQNASIGLQATNHLELKPYSSFELSFYTI
jgi:hypothetical protein